MVSFTDDPSSLVAARQHGFPKGRSYPDIKYQSVRNQISIKYQSDINKISININLISIKYQSNINLLSIKYQYAISQISIKYQVRVLSGLVWSGAYMIPYIRFMIFLTSSQPSKER